MNKAEIIAELFLGGLCLILFISYAVNFLTGGEMSGMLLLVILAAIVIVVGLIFGFTSLRKEAIRWAPETVKALDERKKK